MNGRYKDYLIQQQPVGFDLYQIVKSKKLGTGTLKEPNGEEYEKEVPLGYNMSIESCIKRIAHMELLKEDKIVAIEELIKEYIKQYQEIKTILFES